MTILTLGKSKVKLKLKLNLKLKLLTNYLCICSLKSQAFSICLRRVGWPTSALSCPAKTESVRAGAIFSAELMTHLRVIHWLCGFTKNA